MTMPKQIDVKVTTCKPQNKDGHVRTRKMFYWYSTPLRHFSLEYSQVDRL